MYTIKKQNFYQYLNWMSSVSTRKLKYDPVRKEISAIHFGSKEQVWSKFMSMLVSMNTNPYWSVPLDDNIAKVSSFSQVWFSTCIYSSYYNLCFLLLEQVCCQGVCNYQQLFWRNCSSDTIHKINLLKWFI